MSAEDAPHHSIWPLEGACTCGAVHYRMLRAPLIVHCCHCRWCQRESGASFALNAMIESEYVEVVSGTPEAVMTPSASGKGQKIVRCPSCHVALWSHYAGGGEFVKFVRVGTLADPDRLSPDVHIFTSTKQPWVVLPDSVPAVAEYYDWKELWRPEAQARREALAERRRAAQAAESAKAAAGEVVAARVARSAPDSR